MEKELVLRIKNFNKDREPDFLRLKYRAMRENKYRFFRGTTHLFYEDIEEKSFLFNAPSVWLCGDLHLENFGSYKGDNRVAYFNVNDFDESVLGSPLLDIARLLTSIYIASGSLKIQLQDAHDFTDDFIGSYFQKLKEGYIRVLEKETASGVIKVFLNEIKNRKRKSFIKRRTVITKGIVKLLIDNIHTSKINRPEKEEVTGILKKWASETRDPGFFKVLDIARRIAGTSSLGLKRYVVLVKGKGRGAHYLLDIKETKPSCLNGIGLVKQPKWASDAERITEIQKRFISDPPALLQSIRIKSKHFVLKELQPSADRINYKLFKKDIDQLRSMLNSMACIYAWSNLRAGGRQGSAVADELIHFAGHAEPVKKKLKKYAYDYSKKVNDYYKEYCLAYDKGIFN
jgi:uncharacterized protein (DUF2252 family)